MRDDYLLVDENNRAIRHCWTYKEAKRASIKLLKKGVKTNIIAIDIDAVLPYILDLYQD